MAKTKTIYFCQNCGYESAKWLGKCPSCAMWNTFVEELAKRPSASDKNDWRSTSGGGKRASAPKKIEEIAHEKEQRINSKNGELNRVLGGGIVPGSVVLIAGEPGIGKSTLMLQIALSVNHKVLYVSGEESEQQIKMRADRMSQLHAAECYILAETSTQEIFQQVEKLNPDLLIVDSVQTLYSSNIESAAGSVSQVKQCTAELIKYAKETATPVFLVGHITKEGAIAGPKVLEHMVDTVLQFEGDRHLTYRILRTTKNRFGSTSELGIYEMMGNGLREVSNPSEILISQKDSELSGVTIGATVEGNRPLLIEIQSLVSTAAYGTPQRSSTGYDARRLNMLLAVLEKRCGFRLGLQDVFLNMAGGIKVEDPAIDLAVCSAVISSLEEISVSDKACFAAEVGLGGELRAVNRLDSRIAESEKLGFKEIYVSKFGMKGIEPGNYKIAIKPFARLTDVFGDLFG
ncbi:DNA repair protein RadA [Fulvivirga imtechensis AK7]|uniref:DNA repair protein RadA n=1 Tax=Fulvivirga imtechensis AK7 TaxID=1237149 RepID=L8JR25_9BACT|nr:DNA repair protein RadA [Fulvivirga imtechensis]ELR69782.1 DNA repair protein RadA [Fulvivirga imtechensis AK7]